MTPTGTLVLAVTIYVLEGRDVDIAPLVCSIILSKGSGIPVRPLRELLAYIALSADVVE